MESSLRVCIGCGKAYYDQDWLQGHCGWCHSDKTKPFSFATTEFEVRGVDVEYRRYDWNQDRPHTSGWIKVKRTVSHLRKTGEAMSDMFGIPHIEWRGEASLHDEVVPVKGWTSDPHHPPVNWTATRTVEIERG